MERNPNPDPNCPHCRGTGRRVLFQLPEPCGCIPARRDQAPLPEIEPVRLDAYDRAFLAARAMAPVPEPSALDKLANDPIVIEWCRRVEEKERAHIDVLLRQIQDRAGKDPAGQ